jgi:hypothetical protein
MRSTRRPRAAFLPAALLASVVLAAAPLQAQGAPAAPASPATTVAAAVDADRREVVRVVERLFEAMRTRDTATLRALLDPTLVIVSSSDRPARTRMQRQGTADFLAAIARPGPELRERMWDPEVRVDGAIATLWAPYDFHVGAQRSHCGHDAFQLARGTAGWVVTALAYTVRERCDEAPPASSPAR